MIPNRMEFNVGETIHGQPLRLVCVLRDGREVWELHRDAASQRDDSVFISGLTVTTIQRMALCVASRPID